MSSAPSKIRLADGTPRSYPATLLEELGELVVHVGNVGRGYGDDQALRRRELEVDERAAAIRADLQRMLRDARQALHSAAESSKWPEVHDHAGEASDQLRSHVERWQDQALTEAQRRRAELAQFRDDLAQSIRADLHDYLSRRLAESHATTTVVRRLGVERYVDTLRFEAADALRVELRASPDHCAPPYKLRTLAGKVSVRAGTHQGLFGRKKPRVIRLDPCFVVEAVLSPRAIDLRLATRLKTTDDVMLLRLRREKEEVTAHLTIGQNERQRAEGPGLQQLWDALQRERLGTAARPAEVERVELDDRLVLSPKDALDCTERLVARWRPIVADLVAHTPSPDELCLLVGNASGVDDELWVRTADLTQHLLTIPAGIRSRVCPPELLGPAQVTRESDIIDLGFMMMPDAGADSDVISLHYIPPESGDDTVEAGIPRPVEELASGDITMLHVDRDPEENSGCYDLSKLGRAQPPPVKAGTGSS